MKKKSNRGFMLAETLIVTTFVAGVLLFLFIQFSKLNVSYDDYYNYNNVEDLYALDDIKDYIINDRTVLKYIKDNISKDNYIDITNCAIFYNNEYCSSFFEAENIKKLIVLNNEVSPELLNFNDKKFLDFVKKINNEGDETYRLVAEFNSGRYATIRFGHEEVNIISPDLLDGLLTPVKYNGTDWVVTDPGDNWYNYDKQKWANAVILKRNIKKEIGDIVEVSGFDSDIYAMYVWIPRYEYKIEDNGDGVLPPEIKINFISIKKTIATDGYIIHPAFKFGKSNISGMWVGKFETSHETLSKSKDSNNLGCVNENCENADGLRIIPNVSSLRYNDVSNFFYASRSMGRKNNPFGINSKVLDSHMMKNSEWGAVAYLSQSVYGKYGNIDYIGADKEIYQNKTANYITGISNGTPSQSRTNSPCEYDDTTNNCGIGASTTGTIYGVYDMSGGSHERVMGNYNSLLESSDFKVMPNKKYFDKYTSVDSLAACDGDVCYGHALSETKNWYDDNWAVVTSINNWIVRGGSYSSSAAAGIFTIYTGSGYWERYTSFRLVLLRS